MKVKYLIEQLRKLNPEMYVYTNNKQDELEIVSTVEEEVIDTEEGELVAVVINLKEE